jgi:hypothetical protein
MSQDFPTTRVGFVAASSTDAQTFNLLRPGLRPINQTMLVDALRRSMFPDL